MNLIEFKYFLITPNIFGVCQVLQVKPHSQIFFTLLFKTKSIVQLIKDSVGEWVERTASMQKFFSDCRDVLINHVAKKLQQGRLLQNA